MAKAITNRNHRFLKLSGATSTAHPATKGLIFCPQPCGRTPWWGVYRLVDPVASNARQGCTYTKQVCADPATIGLQRRARGNVQHRLNTQGQSITISHTDNTHYSPEYTHHYRTYYGDQYSSASRQPQWALTTIIIILVSVLQWSSADGRRTHQAPFAVAPEPLTQGHGTYVHTRMYRHLCSTTVDANAIRTQPSAAKAAHGLSIITMNVTSWNSKIYRYVASLSHDVIFIQEHRKTLPSQIRVPKGYKMIFSPAQVTGSKVGGTLNTSGGVATG